MSDNDMEILKVIANPGTSYWLRSALEMALQRDPCDSADDAAYLARLLDIRANELMERVGK